jgi:glucan biosynthesis protein C
MHKRLFYLDNLKTFALLLGVLFHTSIVYAPNVGYAIKSEELNYFFTLIVHSIHVFRMPLFFFLSGFFSDMVLNKHGGKNFTFSRFERMFAPMLVGLFFFAPIQYYLVYNQIHSPISFFEYFPKFFSTEEFDFSHIWFLVYLFIYSFLLMTDDKFHIVKKIFSHSFFGLRKLFLKLQIYILKNYSTNIVFILKTVLFCFAPTLIVNCFFNKDDSFLKIQPVSFTQYLMYFILGAVAYKRNLLQTISPSPIRNNFKVIGIILIFILYLFLNEIDPYWMNFTFDSKRFLLRILHWLIDNSLAWIFIIILLPFFKKYLDHTSSTLDYLRNSGMSIYLIHHPISLLLAHFFLKLQISIFIKFTLHTILVYLLSFFFYQFVIKKSFILKRVFGTK